MSLLKVQKLRDYFVWFWNFQVYLCHPVTGVTFELLGSVKASIVSSNSMLECIGLLTWIEALTGD